MDLLHWLGEHDDIAHTSALYHAGFSRRDLARAESEKRIVRLRRSWIALPGAAPARLLAASVTGRVTCITQAALLGIWTPQDTTAHIAVPRQASHHDATGKRLHWARGPAPVAAHAIADPLINVLFHVARCQDVRDALAVWESAVRKKLIDVDVLQNIDWRSSSARRLARACSALSDSGLETIFIDLMRAIGVSARQQVWIDGHPVDALIGDRIVVQLDGFEHHSSAKDRRRDIRADARLALRGYTVLRFDYAQVMFAPEFVQETIRTAIAQGLHRAR